MPKIPLRRSPRPGHLIVCGSTPLARRLVSELSKRYEEYVTVITKPVKRGDPRKIESSGTVRVVETTQVDDDALQQAKVESARAIAVVDQDDVGNLHVALRARHLNPQIRLVVHFFNTGLGRKISRLLGDCVALSDSTVAAPSFVAGALNDTMTVNHIRLPGRTVHAVPRDRAKRGSVICGLADDTSADRPNLLPEDPDDAEIVLAVADGHGTWLTQLRRRLATAVFQMRSLVSGRLRIALLVMLALLVIGTAFFAADPRYSVWDAIYLTLLDLAGATDPNSELSKVTKLTQILVTVVGISIIPVLTAAVVDAVVSARVNPYGTRRTVPYHGHVVVVGLGNVGTRVIRRLHDLGVPTVCVESNENALGVPVARSKDLHLPVIIGDATNEETLRAAAVDRARAVLAVTSDDVANLETGLQARDLRKSLRLVLRIGDDDLALRVQREFDVDVSRGVAYLAAPAFAAAMVDREVIGTLPFGRRVLLLAEVPVQPMSPLYERPISDVDEPGRVRVIALQRRGADQLEWSPDRRHLLNTHDKLLVVATRTGLGNVLASSISDNAPPDPSS